MEQPLYYKTIDKNFTNKPYAYCKSKQGYLTEKLIKVHKCESIKCMSYERVSDLPTKTKKVSLPYCVKCGKRVEYSKKYSPFTGISKNGLEYTYDKLHIYCKHCGRELSHEDITQINSKEIARILNEMNKERRV